MHFCYNINRKVHWYLPQKKISERKVVIVKKWYRIGICLVLAICLLLLTACKGSPTPSANDPVQITGQNENTDTTRGSETGEAAGAQEDETSDLPQTLDFHWNYSFFEVGGSLGLNDVASAEQITFQRLKDLVNGQSLHYEVLKPEGEYQTALFSLYKTVYPEEFFKDHSMIIIPWWPQNAALEITDVHYTDGVLKCSVKTWLRPEEETSHLDSYILSGWRFYCFIEIDTVLPEGTQIVCDFTEERLDSAEYRAKLDTFRDKCIYYHHTLYD